MSTNPLFISNIPSRQRELIGRLEGAAICRLCRYSWWPPAEAAATCNILQSLVFSYTAGPLLIDLDTGEIIGISSDPSNVSVTVWLEQDSAGERRKNNSILDDNELVAIAACDPVYSTVEICGIVGQRICSIDVILRQPDNEKWKGRPCEAGIRIIVEDGRELILSHGLHDDSDDFSVILKSQIDPRLWPFLRFVPFKELNLSNPG